MNVVYMALMGLITLRALIGWRSAALRLKASQNEAQGYLNKLNELLKK